MKELTTVQDLNVKHKNIIKLFLYFDIFDFPLSEEEIALALPKGENLKKSLEELLNSGLIEQEGVYYFLKGKNYRKRIRENSDSVRFYKKAKAYAKLIHRFPFVRGVYVSGSLSKDWADATTDVDYFIITSASRLWVCRTMLILFKKVFLLNSRKYFCLNYFIDEENLEIANKNVFTATEISFLKPLLGTELFQQFKASNHWVETYYPGPHIDNFENAKDRKHPVLKKMGEYMLRGSWGESLDIWCMKRTIKHWKEKFPEMEQNDFEVNFKSDRSISKHHPSGFQMKVINAYQTKIKEFEEAFQLRL